MKKLTKVLSLVLVIAMALSLCVVGASAESFNDDADINADYAQAVDVMSSIGIIAGMGDGTFAPNGNFTRAQAAKIIAYMQLGVDGAAALKGTSSAFTDVNASDWFAPYVAYCANMGVINGYGNGKFGPNDTLTGYQFAKMLLCAVGYGVNGEYTGDGWQIAVAKDALTKGVYDNVLTASTNDVISREQATQMAFNTLTGIAKVTYSSLAGDYIAGGTISGVTTNGTLGSSVYKLYCTADFDELTIATKYDRQSTTTVAGVEYPSVAGVVCKDADSANTGRYAYVWYQVVNNKAVQASEVYYGDIVVGTANNGEGISAWTTKTNSAYVCEMDSFVDGTNTYVNGAVANVSTIASQVGPEFTFVDTTGNGKADTVLAKTYSVAVATGATATRTQAGVEQVKVPGVVSSWDTAAKYVGTEGIVKDDVVLVYVDEATGITTLTKADVITGTVAAYNSFAGTVTLDNGTTVSASTVPTSTGFVKTVSPATNVTVGDEVAMYVDANGYVVKSVVKSASDTNYAVILDFDDSTMAGQNVKLLTSNGEVVVANAVVGAATTPTTNKYICTGSVSGKQTVVKNETVVSYNVVNDVYYMTLLSNATATAVGTISASAPTKGNASLGSSVIANEATQFILMTSTGAVSTYTGISNVPTTTGTVRAVGIGNVVTVEFILGSSATAVAAQDVIYVTSRAYAVSGTAAAPLYTYQAYRNGEITTVTFSANVSSTIDEAGRYTITGYDANGNAASVTEAASNADTFATIKTNVASYAAGTLVLDSGASWLVNDSTVVINIDENGLMTVGSVSDIQAATSTSYGDASSLVALYAAKNAAGADTHYAGIIFIVDTTIRAV